MNSECIIPIIANFGCVKYQWHCICLYVGFFCCYEYQGFYGFLYNFSSLTLISFKAYVFQAIKR